MMEDVAILLMLAMLLMVYAQVAQDRQVRKLKRDIQEMGGLIVALWREQEVARHD